MSYPLEGGDLIEVRRICFPDYIWENMDPSYKERILMNLGNKLKELQADVVQGVLRGDR